MDVETSVLPPSRDTNKAYWNWKRNIPILYDSFLNHNTAWPSLTIQWGNANAGAGTPSQSQLSTHAHLTTAPCTLYAASNQPFCNNHLLFSSERTGFTQKIELELTIVQRAQCHATSKPVHKCRCKLQRRPRQVGGQTLSAPHAEHRAATAEYLLANVYRKILGIAPFTLDYNQESHRAPRGRESNSVAWPCT